MIGDLCQSRYIRFHGSDNSFKVNSMDWRPSGDHLIAASDDSIVRIFDTNGVQKSAIPSKKHGSACIQWVNDTNTAVFASKHDDHKQGSDIHKIRHLDIERTTFIHYYAGHERQGSDIHKIRHLDIERTTFIHYYAGHERQVTGLSINPNHNCFLSSSLDNTMRLWDSRLDAHIQPGDRRSLAVVRCLSRPVATFGPTGVVFAVWQPLDSSIRLYDLRNYTNGPFKVCKLETSTASGEVHDLSFSANGKLIALSTNGSQMLVLDAHTLTESCVLSGFKNDLRQNLQLSWTPDSKYLYCGSSGTFAGPGNYGHLNMFDASDGTHLKNWRSLHEAFTRIVRFNPLYYMIASACDDIAYWTPS
ncbi:unnamed protein product, partial [Medioppia subpectinata]